jgi:DNA polymerase, archaea type
MTTSGSTRIPEISTDETIPRIVALEIAGDSDMTLFQRTDQRVISFDVEFTPWMVVPAEHSLGLRGADDQTRLGGDGDYSMLVRFSSWSRWREAYRRIRDDSRIPVLAFPSPVEQFLVTTGHAAFLDMEFDELRRAQLDIETIGLNPNDPDGRLIMIALAINGQHSMILRGDEMSEREMIDALAHWIAENDPDVIEGHNIYNFDIPFLAARARQVNRELIWGRDGTAVRFGPERRFKAGARSIPFEPAYVRGRHVIDTYQQIQRYDYSGMLPSYGLKQAIESLGLARNDRVFVSGPDIARMWRDDPDRLAAYAVDDLRDTDVLSRLSLPTEFYQTRLLPSPLQQVAIGGPGEKVNDLLVRAYISRHESVPRPRSPRPYPGGFTELRRIGRFAPVVKCDVESLYPAIMLADRIAPASDHLGVFLPMLESLTTERLAAKREAALASGYEHARWNGVQSSLKVLINSFYGYLGYSRGYFNDYDAAERVTLHGHKIIKQVTEELEARGSRTIEVDTDGVYFEPPAGLETPEKEVALIDGVSQALGTAFNLAHDGRWKAMLSLRLKNYALLEYDGRIVLKGSGLRSRREEGFLRTFIADAANLYLTEGQDQRVRDIYLQHAKAIVSGALPPEDIARTETITESTFRSDSTKRLAQAVGSERIGERVAVYQKRSGELSRIESYADDEDRQYLLRRLRSAAERFRPLFDSAEAFDYDFPSITLRTDIEALKQSDKVDQLKLF